MCKSIDKTRLLKVSTYMYTKTNLNQLYILNDCRQFNGPYDSSNTFGRNLSVPHR